MKVFAFDLESFLIMPGRHAPRAVSLAWDYGNGPQLLHCILERDRFRAVVEEGLEADFIVGANVAYDLAIVANELPDLLPKIWKAYDENRVWDVEHTEKLCDLHDGKLWWHWDPNYFNKKTKKLGAMVKVSYSLAAIVFRRFGIVLDKDTWRLLYGTLANTPCHLWPQGARDYALLDASITYRVWAAQAAEPFSKLVDLARQARAGWWLHLMVARGFRVDPEQVEKLAASIWNEREHVAARLKAAGLVRANGSRDTKIAAARMIAVCKAKNIEIKQTAKGKTQITKETARDTGDPTLLDYARFTSLTSMWKGSIVTLRAAAKAGMPIQSRFEVLQETGRTSCSGSAKAKKGRDPYELAYSLQLQNVRRGLLDEDGEEQEGVRECFVPRDGFVLNSSDYAQLELCTLAQVCIDLDCGSALAEALNAGIDVHCMLGAQLIGRTYDEVYANRKKEKWAKDARQMAKCFHPDTEVLTRNGWVKISELSMGVEVAAAQVVDGGEVKIVWEQPTRLTRNTATELVHLYNEGIDLRVTPDHRMVAWLKNTRGQKAARRAGVKFPRRVGKMITCSPEELDGTEAWPNAGVMDAGAMSLDEERLLRLAVATQADGSYFRRKIRFGFSKQRKIDRLRALLRDGEYDYSEVKNGKWGRTKTFLLCEELSSKIRLLLDDKIFPWWWLSLAEIDRRIILDEARYWDATSTKGGTQYIYFSSIRQNIDVLQAIASITGHKTRERLGTPFEMKDGGISQGWTLSVKMRHTTRGGNLTAKRIPHDGDVFCLTVPSDAVLVRDGGVPVITRQCGNFGLPGGLGAGGLIRFAKASYNVILTEQEAQHLKHGWHATWPEMEKFFRFVRNCVGPAQEGAIVQVRSWRRRGGCGFTDGANGFFQALAADLAKDAGYRVTKACFDPSSSLFGSRILNFVHDELIVEHPEDRAHDAAMEVKRLMEDASRTWCPDVPSKVEPALMRRWYKGAEPKFENGILVPWAPA